MNEQSLNRLAFQEIGLNLIIGDIPPDLADLLTPEEIKKITEIRVKIGQEFINKSGIPSITDWKEIVQSLP